MADTFTTITGSRVQLTFELHIKIPEIKYIISMKNNFCICGEPTVRGAAQYKFEQTIKLYLKIIIIYL